MTYQAELTCCRCGAKRYVPSFALRFRFWICLPLRRCGTINEWK